MTPRECSTLMAFRLVAGGFPRVELSDSNPDLLVAKVTPGGTAFRSNCPSRRIGCMLIIGIAVTRSRPGVPAVSSVRIGPGL